MKRAALDYVGRLDLVDLQALSDSVGREFLPHPFVQQRPTRFANYEEYAAHRAAAPGRLRDGDLSDFNAWFTGCLNADIRVECVVSIVGAPRGRLLAHRRGESGFLAAQRSEDHAVDIYTVSPYDLGLAIVGALALTQPGKHPKIVIPEFVRQPTPSVGEEDSGFTIRQLDLQSDAKPVPRTDVKRYTRIQSRWQPARDWGFDRTKDLAVYVAIDDDGDYLYAPKFHYLTTMTARNLADRIDSLIADDVANVREFRSRESV